MDVSSGCVPGSRGVVWAVRLATVHQTKRSTQAHLIVLVCFGHSDMRRKALCFFSKKYWPPEELNNRLENCGFVYSVGSWLFLSWESKHSNGSSLFWSVLWEIGKSVGCSEVPCQEATNLNTEFHGWCLLLLHRTHTLEKRSPLNSAPSPRSGYFCSQVMLRQPPLG